jgi:histone H3/H4
MNEERKRHSRKAGRKPFCKGELERLLRRSGVKRVEGTTYTCLQEKAIDHLTDILSKCVFLLEKRVTISTQDVNKAFNHVTGHTFYSGVS